MDIKSFKKNKLPDKPGVYFFKKGKSILYIGKATSLRDRVKSYFGKDLIETRGPLLVDLIFKADKIDWQETDSVLEALILEAFLIKRHQPKYNTKEKSDKSFNYVCITKDKKIDIVRGKVLNKKNYNSFFGPFPNGNQLREALKIIRKIFPFFYEKRGIKGGDEFYKQIKLAPENLVENKNNIKNIKLLFEGKKKKIFINLKKEMNVYSKNREFEKAGEIKRQLFALQHINDIALLKYNTDTKDMLSDSPRKFSVENFLYPSPFRNMSPAYFLLPRARSRAYLSKPFLYRIEAYDIAHMGGKNMVGVMVVLEDGEVNKSEYKKFKIKTQNNANDTGALKEVIERRLTHSEWPHPTLIVVDGGVAQINIAESVLLNLNLDIPVVSVLKDEKHKPKDILSSSSRPSLKGSQVLAFIKKYKREILLANSEAHRFAINYHKKLRNKNFLK